MDANGEGESMSLLDNKKEVDDSASKSGNDVTSTDRKVVNLKEAFYIMVGLSLGTGILVMPFTVRQLGVVLWISSLIGILTLQCICTYLLSVSTQHMAEQNYEAHGAMRDAYQAVSELSGGHVLRKVSVLLMYASSMGMCISLLIVAASLLADLIPIGSFTNANLIRIWTTIVISALTPIMYLGTYSDMKVPAVIAIVTSLTSAIAIIVNCILKKYVIADDVIDRKPQEANQNFLIPAGTIIFVTAGAALTIPNITVIASAPEKLVRSIISCYVCVLIVLLGTGLVPYFVFGEHILPSVMSTFSDVINSNESGIVFNIVTMVMRLLMLFHLTMASILSINPCFLHLEEILNVPRELNLKRVLVRTLCMLTILGICILIPQFEFAISIAGGVPLTFMGISLPVLIYSRLFEMSIYKKTWIYLFLLATVVFIFGNLVVSIRNLFVS